jgi:hypothetical protein
MSTSERSEPNARESEVQITDRVIVEKERYAKIKLVLQVCQTLGIILVALSIYVSWRSFQEQQRSFHDQHEWNRRQFTSELLGRFNAELKDHRAPIMQAFPGLFNQDSSEPPSRDECRKILKAKKGQFSIKGVDAFELRNHIVSVLNYFEDLTLAWESQTGDQATIKDSVSITILRWHDFFHNFILEVNDELGGDAWPPLNRVVGTWKAESEQKAKSISKTGSGN